MEIKSFRLVNVGRFSDLEVALAPTERHASKVTVLVGNNGAGKTTLLKSVATSLSWLVARVRTPKGAGSRIDEGMVQKGVSVFLCSGWLGPAVRQALVLP
ncbi:AAA family ATPase, partial [Pseudomonas savastanoi]|uniref:AAA family ATPase n=2 Tax=Pseudomonas savastanoi TaxID=29438 RepID=UPI001F21FCF2